ncbi:amidase [Siccirubricoccus phaeus]|uniref:amidase n=1 Tax=Siccirubricoccus phaeus TaxID=2595053 RepID=UPI0011F26CC7|nr:amidase [Siccirubricoccus phaeus]
MTSRPLWQFSATELGALIQSGEVSASEAVQAAVDRMQAVDPALNAVVTDLSASALARARALDAAPGPKGPLHGIPVTIKINIDQKGEASSNGVAAFKDLIAPDDAPLVKNLLDAGAVVIGRTNVPEFSRRCETSNPLFGATWNPWGRHVSAGGSSGGAGAAVAAGIGALAHGNDIGGSLRFPAAGNGVATIKPGVGRVPVYNPSQTAERGILAQQMSAQGLLVRSARDLHLAMPAMIAPDARDPFHVPLPWRGAALAAPIKVGFSLEVLDLPLHPEVEKALLEARAALVEAGYVVEEVAPPSLREIAFEGRTALMTESYHLMAEDIEKYGSPEIVNVFEQNYRRTPAVGMAEFLKILARRTFYARQWSVLMAEYPLFLAPFFPQPFYAPGRDAEGAEGLRATMGQAFWSTLGNYLGLPAGVLPVRLGEIPEGPKPIAVQLFGRRWREDAVVDAMIAIEDRLGTLSQTLWQRMGESVIA